MKCPFCGYEESKVIDSRPVDENSSIRRRRECMKCNKRFTTYETIEMMEKVVIKRDMSRQPYSRSKVIGGLMRACEKRPVSLAQMDFIADSIESELYQSPAREIDSYMIGEKIMERLKELDEVAYVRYASVYKRFNNLETFMEELQELINKDGKN